MTYENVIAEIKNLLNAHEEYNYNTNENTLSAFADQYGKTLETIVKFKFSE